MLSGIVQFEDCTSLTWISCDLIAQIEWTTSRHELIDSFFAGRPSLFFCHPVDEKPLSHTILSFFPEIVLHTGVKRSGGFDVWPQTTQRGNQPLFNGTKNKWGNWISVTFSWSAGCPKFGQPSFHFLLFSMELLFVPSISIFLLNPFWLIYLLARNRWNWGFEKSFLWQYSRNWISAVHPSAIQILKTDSEKYDNKIYEN